MCANMLSCAVFIRTSSPIDVAGVKGKILDAREREKGFQGKKHFLNISYWIRRLENSFICQLALFEREIFSAQIMSIRREQSFCALWPENIFRALFKKL